MLFTTLKVDRFVDPSHCTVQVVFLFMKLLYTLNGIPSAPQKLVDLILLSYHSKTTYKNE